jgi:aryl-alcohol dehydrogenase-like predicted oxidoreductase
MTGGATRPIAGRDVLPIGFGAMPLSTAGRPSEADGLRTIHAVLDAGVRLVDTADAYCLDRADTGHNELLIARALAAWSGDRASVLVATKGGHVRGADGSWSTDGRPEHLRAACDASLRRLGTDAVALYQFHRPDPAVPFLESVGALAELWSAGKVRAVGLSNVDVGQLDAARDVVPIASVQNELGPHDTSALPLVRRCAELGIAFLAWAPLGGARAAGDLGRRHPPFGEVAAARGVSPQRVALAWLLSLGPTVIPIPGARRAATALDSVMAADLVLTAAEVARLTPPTFPA